MARLVGTGKDPLNRYPEGLVFDALDGTAEYQSLIDLGFAQELPPEDDPAKTKWQVAEAMVRGDTLSDPVEKALVKEIGADAHAIVHLSNPDASSADYDKATENVEQGLDDIYGVEAIAPGEDTTIGASKQAEVREAFEAAESPKKSSKSSDK